MLTEIEVIEFKKGEKNPTERLHSVFIDEKDIIEIRPIDAKTRTAGKAPMNAQSGMLLADSNAGDQSIAFMRTPLRSLFDTDNPNARVTPNTNVILANVGKVDLNRPFHARELDNARLRVVSPTLDDRPAPV